MAIEPKRGCGYRKVSGLYLVGGGIGIPCDRLPFELTVCSCCGQGIKQARGWTWIDVAKFFNGPHTIPSTSLLNNTSTGPEQVPCYESFTGNSKRAAEACPLCAYPETMGRAGLLWIGEKFYKFPGQFVAEGVSQGFSRRIKAVPQGFRVGETWVMLAHSKAVVDWEESAEHAKVNVYKPGIFYAWLPQRLELLMKESQRNSKEAFSAATRGIVLVFVPDNDPDHQGNVHDDLEREKREEASE